MKTPDRFSNSFLNPTRALVMLAISAAAVIPGCKQAVDCDPIASDAHESPDSPPSDDSNQIKGDVEPIAAPDTRSFDIPSVEPSETLADVGPSEPAEAEPCPESSVPESTVPILRQSTRCITLFRERQEWCFLFAGSPDICESAPPEDRAECEENLAKCDTAWGDFSTCVDEIPFDSSCAESIQPFSALSDVDGDGLSDHAELWHLQTNPCEPCSYGDEEPCDSDGDYDKDGILNGEDTTPTCSSFVLTDECG